MLKFFKLGFNSMWTENFQMFKLDLEKQRNQRSNCQHPLDHRKSKRIPEKHLLLSHWLHYSLWLCGTSFGEFLTRWEYQTPSLPLVKPVCRSRTNQTEPDMEQQTGSIGKGVHQGCILSPCLFNLHAEYIMWNARLDEAQAGIKTAGRNVNNLWYADNTTPMAASKEQKILLMRMKKENEKAGLQVNIQKLRSWHPVPSLHGK